MKQLAVWRKNQNHAKLSACATWQYDFYWHAAGYLQPNLRLLYCLCSRKSFLITDWICSKILWPLIVVSRDTGWPTCLHAQCSSAQEMPRAWTTCQACPLSLPQTVSASHNPSFISVISASVELTPCLWPHLTNNQEFRYLKTMYYSIWDIRQRNLTKRKLWDADLDAILETDRIS